MVSLGQCVGALRFCSQAKDLSSIEQFSPPRCQKQIVGGRPDKILGDEPAGVVASYNRNRSLAQGIVILWPNFDCEDLTLQWKGVELRFTTCDSPKQE